MGAQQRDGARLRKFGQYHLEKSRIEKVIENGTPWQRRPSSPRPDTGRYFYSVFIHSKSCVWRCTAPSRLGPRGPYDVTLIVTNFRLALWQTTFPRHRCQEAQSRLIE